MTDSAFEAEYGTKRPCIANPCPGCSTCNPLVKADANDARFGPSERSLAKTHDRTYADNAVRIYEPR